MTAEHVLERLSDGMAVITPGDRSDVVLAMASAHAAEGFPSLSCLILNGGLPLHPSIAALVSGLGLRLPIVATDLGTYDTARAVAQARGRVTASSQRKIDTALELMDTYVDTAELIAQLSIPIPSVVTPQMFNYQLLDRARSDRKRIVLPEGDDDRILRGRRPAAAALGGRPHHPRRRARRPGARRRARRRPVATPWCSTRQTSELCDQFAEQYAQLRKHKGITVEQAREIIHDVSYFGTMMVHNEHGRRHGVRRRAHHRAHDPARPSRSSRRCPDVVDGVEHLPDVPGRPGAGLRRLRDRAGPDVGAAGGHRDLVGAHGRAVRHRAAGGDAVVLDRRRRGRAPTSTRSGRQRELVREREPDLLVEGPIQYDAAVEPSVASHQDAGLEGRRPRHRVDLPRPQHRQQHLQGRAAQRGRHRDRTRCCRGSTNRSTTCPAARWSRTSSTPWPSPRSRRRASR